jgi:ATP-dependent Zn protease
VEREADEEKMLYSKPELEGLIRQLMGGRASEIIYYGKELGLTTGASNDLKAATRYAEHMVRSYGMEEEIGHIAIDPSRLADGPLAIKISAAAEKIIRHQLEQAIEELRNQRENLDKLVEALMEKNRLTLNELEDILKPLT